MRFTLDGKEFLDYYGSHSDFSNMSRNPFTIKGNKFHCVEQYFQFFKAKYFGDEETAKEILECYNGFEAKKLGRKVRGFNSSKWNSIRDFAMKRGMTAKFSQCGPLWNVLQDTVGMILVEASPYDRYWGVGHKYPDKVPTCKWGRNKAGELLMEVRAEKKWAYK
jgi:ribA/ribD-fused uncharacterized protein